LPEPETWGLGIDDGPNCTNSLFYDFLKENNQKASLYYIGSNVYNWPQQARRGIEDGHQVCVHTWSHPAMTSRTNSQAFAELYYTRLVIQKILGRTPLCWRPPYGDVDNRIRFIASKLNLTLHLWSDDTFDWQVGQNNVTVQDVTANYEKVYAKAQNGTYTTHGPMVLNHEVNNYTMTEIIAQYPAMKQNFKHIVPIATGLNVTQPYAEPEIIYPTFEEYIGGEIQEAVVSNGVTVTQTSPSTSKTSGKSSTGSSGASNSNAAASVLVSSSTVLAGVFAALLL
jgi:hypothetical protein